MKQILSILCLLLLTGTPSRGQGNFAPVGAEWYHNANHWGSILKVSVEKDTMINGIACRKVVQKHIHDHTNTLDADKFYPRKSFVYERDDTVFIYQEYWQKFTPLYVFNVSEGQSVCLPIPEFKPWLPTGVDSVFCFYVDSVRMVTYDTAVLKTFYTSPYNSWNGQTIPTYNFSGHSGPGMYAEKIGALGGVGLFPYCSQNCIITHNGWMVILTDGLRCYTDPFMAIHLTDTCDGGPLSVEGNTFATGLQIAPVPANDVLRIALPGATHGSFTVSISDISGRRFIHKSGISPGTTEVIDVSTFPAGLYVLELNDNRGNSAFRKILIGH